MMRSMLVRRRATLSVVFVLTVAPDRLTTAGRAPLDVAAGHMELARDGSAVVTCPFSRAPIVGLVTVANASKTLAGNRVGEDLLRSCDSLGPVRKDPHSAILNQLVGHTLPRRLTDGRFSCEPRRLRGPTEALLFQCQILPDVDWNELWLGSCNRLLGGHAL